MSDRAPLPPGQYELDHFPRFGLSQFAGRFPTETGVIRLEVTGEVGQPIVVEGGLPELPRVEQASDFHCVTTWSRRSLRWSGFRFADFFERVVVPRARPRPEARLVVLRGQDGYATSLPLEDVLAPEVLMADRLDGEPLTIGHGAPLRLVAPAHYGYKNPKHLCGVAFWEGDGHYRPPTPFRFMSHPRGRVALEERGTGVPGWLLRYLYRPLVRVGIWQFRRAMERHQRRITAPSR